MSISNHIIKLRHSYRCRTSLTMEIIERFWDELTMIITFVGGFVKKREICCGPLLLLQRIRKQLSSDIDRYYFYFYALFHLIIYITCFECQNHFDNVRAKFYHVEDKVKSHVGSVMIPRIGYNLG